MRKIYKYYFILIILSSACTSNKVAKKGIDLDDLISSSIDSLVLEDKSYFLNKTTIIQKSNFKIIGKKNSIIICENQTQPAIILKNCRNLTFSNICFKGNYSFENIVNTYLIKTDYESQNQNVTFNDCTFDGINKGKGFSSIFLIDKGSDHFTFKNNLFKDTKGFLSGQGYIMIISESKNHIIENNVFVGDSIGGRHGVYIVCGSSGNIVKNNTFSGFHFAAITIGAYEHQKPCINNSIFGNILNNDNIEKGIYEGQISVFGNTQNNIIEKNTINSSNSYGILLNAYFGDGKDSNRIVRDTKIIDNELKNIYKSGIVNAGCKNTLISGNKLTNISTISRNVYSGIWIGADQNYKITSQNVTVEKNKYFSIEKNKLKIDNSFKEQKQIFLKE
jgi:Right handed beta helix region